MREDRIYEVLSLLEKLDKKLDKLQNDIEAIKPPKFEVKYDILVEQGDLDSPPPKPFFNLDEVK